MDMTPDLSHLSADERRIIEAVFNREKAEAKRDSLHNSSPHDDYSAPSVAITSRRYSQSNESGAYCQICQRTKFVNEQSSRQCSICQKRFCVRCGIRVKSHYYLCQQCRQKQEHYFSSTRNICKQYVSDYILSQTSDSNVLNTVAIHPQRVLPNLNTNDDASSPESVTTTDNKQRLLPVAKQDMRSMNILRDFQYHSLEDREIGHESTLKDSGIDTASSSTILNVISTDQFQKPMTYWRFNETRTEQIGYIYLKNNLSTYEREHGKLTQDDIFNALGLKIQLNDANLVEITEVISGSIADTYGQLRMGDQIIEWNGDKLKNIHSKNVNRVLSQISLQSPQIHMIVKRSLRNPIASNNNDHLLQNRFVQEDQIIPSIIATRSIQLQLSFQYDENCLHIMIYGARNIPLNQGLLACQVSLESEYDISSKQDKCTKGQPCSSGSCTWNQHIIFFDLDTLENVLLWIKLINLEHRQEILGEMKFQQFNLSSNPQWYKLNNIADGSSCNRPHLSTTDVPPVTQSRKRQLPDIPTARLEANREKVSQDLFQKAAELKLRLHMQSKNDRPLLTQRSFDQTDSIYKQLYEDRPRPNDDNSRKSMMNLTSKATSTMNLKEKVRIPIIRDKSVPATIPVRRTTTTTAAGPTTPSRVDMEKTKTKSFEEKYRKTIKKRYPSETQADDVDSDGSEMSFASRQSTNSAVSTQSERHRHLRKQNLARRSNEQFYQNDEVQLNEEELRQMAMRTHDTSTNPTTTTDTSATKTSAVASATTTAATTTTTNVSNTKTGKGEQRNDGTLSDSALSTQSESNKKRQPSMSSKALVILGLSKKANSSSNLGGGKRYGFQRSEEVGVQPHLRNRTLQQQTSKENETPSSAPPTTSPSQSLFNPTANQHHSLPPDMAKLWSGALKLPHEHQFSDFIEGLGKGQLVGRQVLASPCHGEIQIGLRNQNGILEVEIVRARNLIQKTFYKLPPAPYVKVYLLDGKTCVEKQRTRTTRRTLDPLIQQTLLFKEYFRDKILQISIWGDYGKFDRKVFMGVCQIGLDEVNLNTSQQTLDWYKLFSANSLMNSYTIVQQSSKRKNTIS